MSKSPKAKLASSLAIAATALATVAVVGYFSYRTWAGIGASDGGAEVEMSIHGWLALGLGVVVTLAVGIGLMALVFYSSRKNYDDAAGQP